jgi:hypothetical protein
MGLEKEIFQSKFRNDYQKSVINLIYTFHWINKKLKSIFEKESITSQQFNILRILRGAGKPMSTLQIRQRMLDKMSDTSRIVDRLVTKGLVKKNICEHDKRLVDIFITEKGMKLLNRMDNCEIEMDSFLSKLTEEETKKLNKLLDKIRTLDEK